MGLLRSLVRTRATRGVLAGSPFWIGVGVLVVARRVIRVLAPRTEVVYREELKPGRGLVINHLTERHDDGT
jgi:hypothetical protein